ncbi:hypothetical protein Tco_1234970 [Tanacetum coccineum]
MALSPSLEYFRTALLSFSAKGQMFKVNVNASKKLLWRERTTLGSSRSPNFPQGSINPCEGLLAFSTYTRVSMLLLLFTVQDCPDCEDSQFCHSSRVSHPQLHLGNRSSNLIDLRFIFGRPHKRLRINVVTLQIIEDDV